MPQSITIAAFVFGAVLLLIAILHGGGFKIFGAEVSGQAGKVGRAVAGFLGIVLLCVGLNGAFEKPNEKDTAKPANDTSQQQNTPANPHPGDQGNKPQESGVSPIHSPSNQTLVADNSTKNEPAEPTSTGPKSGEPAASEQPANIAGIWRDAAGSVYQIAQQGGAITIRVSGVNGVGVATGTIRGRQIEDAYELQYVNGTRSAGRCSGMISAEMNLIRGTCWDSVYGQSENILMR